MDQSNTKEPRGPVSLRIKFRSANLDQFIERYAIDVSRGGIFIRTREPLAVGTQLKFDFQLQDSAPLLAGDGTVVWIREHDPARAGVTPGMGVRFDKLTPASQPVLEKILSDKAARDQSGLGGASALRVGPNARRASSTFSAVEPMLGATAGRVGAPAPAGDAAAMPRPPLAASGLPSAPLTLPPSSPGAPPAPPGAARTIPGAGAARTLTPPPSAAGGLPRRTPPPAGPLGGARPTGLRPSVPSGVGGARPPLGSDALAARARTSTGIGMGRPAPVAPSLFEPPSSEDIDKALEALKEAPGGESHAAAPLPPPVTAAPTTSVVDDMSNEPTRITDLPPNLEESAEPAAAVTLDEPPRRTGAHPLAHGEPASSPSLHAAPVSALEPDASDRTDQNIIGNVSAIIEPTPPIAPPSTPPAPRFTPAGGGRVSATMAMAASAQTRVVRRSKAPVIVTGVVLAAATAGAALFLLNRAPGGGTHGAETAAATPSAAGTPAAAAPVAPAPAAGEQPAAAAAEKKPDEAQAGAAKTAAPVAPEPAVAAAPPPPPPAPPEKSLHGAARKAAAARRRLAAAKGGGDTASAAAAPAAAAAAAAKAPEAADDTTAPPTKVEVVGQGGDDDKAAAAPAKDDKDDAPAAAGSQHVLKISTTPPGAEVVVDGASVGKTPFFGNQFDPATPHAITLKKDGYENHEHMIGSSDWSRPHNGVQTLKLTIKLRKAGGGGGGGGDKAKSADTEAAAPAGDTAAPAAKKDDKKDEAPASP